MFSKLESKRWPQREEVIDKVAAYIYKCDLIVMVVFDEETNDSERIPKNIEVILKPYREKPLQQKNTNTFFENEKSTFSSIKKHNSFIKWLKKSFLFKIEMQTYFPKVNRDLKVL